LVDVWSCQMCSRLTTMACHIYEPIYCKVMSIAICDM
jgi:hypothetical protein